VKPYLVLLFWTSRQTVASQKTGMANREKKSPFSFYVQIYVHGNLINLHPL